MAEISEAPAVEVAAATGHIVAVVTGAEGPEFRRIAVPAVVAGLAAAATAVQPGDLGGAASLEVSEIEAMVDERLGDIEAVLAAIVGPQ